MPTLEQLNSQFAIPGFLKFVSGNGGLIKAALTTPDASAEVYLHGGHVTQFQPAGQGPVLFVSEKSKFEAGKAIRGGVPICFPWFGNLEGHPEAPAHGFARTLEWSVVTTSQYSDGGVGIELTLESSGNPALPWPYAFKASYSIAIEAGPILSLNLQVKNTSNHAFKFEEALHSYFHVSDVRSVSITGLERTPYLDKLQSGRETIEGADPIRIVGETDRVYLGTTNTCVVADPALSRQIRVMKEDSNSTVLWNPWIAKAKSMSDFGDDEWPAMLCIETCNVGRHAITLQPGDSHIMTAEIQSSQ